MAKDRYRHIFLQDPPETTDFTSTSSGSGARNIPPKDPKTHSQHLINRFSAAWEAAEIENAVFKAGRNGVYIEFKSDPGAELVTKSLEDFRSKDKIRLLNVRLKTEGEKQTTYATVYVPYEKQNLFLDKMQAYANETTDTGKPKHADLLNSISDIRKAMKIKSFWQDAEDLIPEKEKAWCEVWLSSDEKGVIKKFEIILDQNQIESTDGYIRFPERTIKMILANRKDLELLTTLSDDIAEFRRAKETAAIWLDMENHEQAQWVEDLLSRSDVSDFSDLAVCILDTGVNNGHPLLAPLLTDQDCMAVNSSWGVDDHDGHGTLMAGLAAYGNLRKSLISQEPIALRHCLESVKILPCPPEYNEPELWGYITSQALSLAKIQNPVRSRICCMAVAASDKRDRGRPSSWSGAIDQITSGADSNEKCLFILCAGNSEDLKLATNYPESQITDSIHDPAQAWNALTVGAYTQLYHIRDKSLDGFLPIAQPGSISPFTTTSFVWDNRWPIKPEIVMEGGNMAHNNEGFATECDDLSLISTFFQPTDHYFYPFNMTSAATAQSAWFAAKLQKAYPEYWPETIRGLMVHSAQWTDEMKAQFLDNDSKTSYAKLLRICGYGVPDLDRAISCASNSLTLVAQNELQPFNKKENNQGYKTHEMHIYDVPWPTDVLLDLPDEIEIKMRITLSYFVEPGPGEIGWKDRYRYPSHGLRFDVKSPGESRDLFIKRINAAARQEDEGHPGTKSASDHWVIGKFGRDKGSLHSDIWEGTAAELADSGIIAVYPVIGWWRERGYLNKWDSKSRYALIISISTPEEDIDIYTPVAIEAGIAVPVEIET